MPALRGTAPTNKAYEVPAKAVAMLLVASMSKRRGNAQSSSSITTPSSTFMAGSISKRRNTTGCEGPNTSPEARRKSKA